MISFQHVPHRTHAILPLTQYSQWSIHFLKRTWQPCHLLTCARVILHGLCAPACLCVLHHLSACVCKPVGHTGLCVDPRAHLVWSDFLPAGWCGTVAQMLQRLQLSAVFGGEASRPFRKINTMGEFVPHTQAHSTLSRLLRRDNPYFCLCDITDDNKNLCFQQDGISLSWT